MTMAMFNNIDAAMTEFFPQAVRSSAECLVTIKRIEVLISKTSHSSENSKTGTSLLMMLELSDAG